MTACEQGMRTNVYSQIEFLDELYTFEQIKAMCADMKPGDYWTFNVDFGQWTRDQHECISIAHNGDGKRLVCYRMEDKGLLQITCYQPNPYLIFFG